MKHKASKKDMTNHADMEFKLSKDQKNGLYYLALLTNKLTIHDLIKQSTINTKFKDVVIAAFITKRFEELVKYEETKIKSRRTKKK